MRRQQGGQGKLLTLQPLLSSGDRTVQLKQGDSSNKPTAPSFGTYQGVASDTLLHISPGTIICVYLSSRITSTFEDFVFLMAYSSLERPVPGNWSFQNPRLPTIPTHPGLSQTMITPGVGPTLTIVKARSGLQHPPLPVPPLLRSSRVYPYHHIRPVNIYTHFLDWRLLPRRIRPDRLRRRFGTLMNQLEQKEAIIPVLLRTARLSRASV